jgi:2'-5' RNA ligase
MGYESNCAMLYLDCPDMATVQRVIDKNDIYDPQDMDMRYGFEKEPHITLLFGLDPSVPLSDVCGVMDKHTFVRGRLVNPSLFKNDLYEVLKFDVDAESLKRFSKVNSQLTKFPYKTDHPDYHPHCTIAYLKPGTGDKYVVMLQFDQIAFAPAKGVYSEVSGAKSVIKINIL